MKPGIFTKYINLTCQNLCMSCPCCHYQNACFNWISRHGYLEPNNSYYTVNGLNILGGILHHVMYFWLQSFPMWQNLSKTKYLRPFSLPKEFVWNNKQNESNHILLLFSIPIISFKERGASCYRIDLATTSSWQRCISPARLQSRSLLYHACLAKEQGCFALISS